MKKLLILSVLVLLSSCEMTTPKTTAITILADRTDPVIPEPVITDILPLLSVKEHPNMGLDLRLQNIGDVDYQPVYPLILKPAGMFDNTLQRKSNIKHFMNAVDTLLTRHNRTIYDYEKSSILFSVTDHLIKLKDAKAEDKYLVLYSDLAESSDLFDSYSHRSLILKHSDKVAENLIKQITIPDLSGVTLYIKYHPNTSSNNRLFKAWCEVYTILFKSSGLDIQIGINTNYGQ
ncbi:hypothetical protein [uncultured Dokdonia sp.]|uniref:hypothetical protein n=1 Tax=uncultured Dokdonia sp. TaxID=575653 RepID=UPI00262001DF|nr:hypothetical protein [uncultured Dokdonia sp.]